MTEERLLIFLDQKKDRLLLFRFLHALSEDLSSSHRKGLLADFPHPGGHARWHGLASAGFGVLSGVSAPAPDSNRRRSETQAATEQRLRSETPHNHR